MVHSEKRAHVAFSGTGIVWMITKIMGWLFRPEPTKLEKEVAAYKKLVKQIGKRIERNRKRLEEMRKDKVKPKK